VENGCLAGERAGEIASTALGRQSCIPARVVEKRTRRGKRTRIGWPVSGLFACVSRLPKLQATQWLRANRIANYRCGGSSGLGVFLQQTLAPLSRFTHAHKTARMDTNRQYDSSPCNNSEMATVASPNTLPVLSDGALIRRLFGYVVPYRSKLIGAATLLAMVSLIEPFILLVFGRIVDRAFVGAATATVTAPQGQLAQSFLAPMIAWFDQWPVAWFPLFVVAMFVFRSVCNFLGDIALHWVSSRVVFDVRVDTFTKMLRLPMRFFDRNAAAELTSKITFDAQQIGASCSQALTALVQDSFKLLGSLGMLLFLSWKLTLGVLVIAPLVALVIRFITKRLRRASQAMQATMGELARFSDEALTNQKTVKSFNAFSMLGSAFTARANRFRQAYMKQETANAASAPLTHIAVSLAIAVIVSLAIGQGQRGEMTAGEFSMFFAALLSLLPPLKSLSSVNAIIQRGLAAALGLFAVQDEPAEQLSRREHPKLPKHVPANALGRIAFERVGFRYESREVDALTDVSFIVEPGQHVALVGGSGSGKSSVMSLICGFYEPSAGVVSVNGKPLADTSLGELRQSLALVSQDVLLVNDTVAANIAFGDTSAIDLARVRAAARAAGAEIFIDELPDGFATNVGEGGSLLSGGQRQRIALARAFYKDAPIVLFDEATSALDSASERIVQESLRAMTGTRTVVQIAHRLSSVREADTIYVFANGRIVESGSHETLLRRNAAYAALVSAQAT
jgi:ATP-binding cassette, subfamily B, bacterial MsbA